MQRKNFIALCTSLCIGLTHCTFAATATPNLCNNIDGFYSGNYVDTTHLFPARAFPINVFLTHINHLIYGYTLAADDQRGAGYGTAPYAFIWGQCQNNQISNLYIIKSDKSCGSPAKGPFTLNADASLNLTFNYENAMINANLQTTLRPAPMNQTVNETLLKQAQILSTSNSIQTCH